MREIKFRAWDKKLKKWYAPIYEAYNGKLFELTRGYLCVRTMEGMFGTDPNSETMTTWADRFEIMQYTGRHDSKGVEIYEGDKVNIIYYLDHLKYNNPEGGLEPDDPIMALDRTEEINETLEVKIPDFYIEWERLQKRFDEDPGRCMTVIGNQYEGVKE